MKWPPKEGLAYLELGLFLVPLIFGPRKHPHTDPGLPRVPNGNRTDFEARRGLLPGDEALIPKIAAKWTDLAEDAHELYPNISVPLILAIVHAESRGNPKAVSPIGEEGLMQLTPPQMHDYAVVDGKDPWDNLEGGTHLLSDLWARYHGALQDVVMAFQWGESELDQYQANQRRLDNDVALFSRRVLALLPLYQTIGEWP